MRLRNIPRAEEVIEKSRYVVQQPSEWKGRWKEYFGNDHPVCMEIGMGKGQFITEMARRNPEINYIGVEKYSSVLLRAVEKTEEEEIPNLVFLCVMAEQLEEIVEKGELAVIYLNFSDPWPKDRHHKRRLTSREHLAEYEKLLAEGGVLEFKTDNEGLFDFSLEEVPETGWKFLAVTRDLHHDPMGEGNVMTEYESKFSAKGQPIFKMIICPDRSRVL